jgi:hypothetical protein
MNDPVINADQKYNTPFGLKLTDEQEQPLGAVRLRYDPTGNGQFEMMGAVDSKCRPITKLVNQDQPANGPSNLENWDTLVITFGETNYGLHIGYTGTAITVDFTRR